MSVSFETRTLLGRLTWGDLMSSQVLHEPIWPAGKAVQSPWAGCSGVVLRSWEIRTPESKGVRSRGELTPKLEHWWTERRACERREPRRAAGGTENRNLLFCLCKLLLKPTGFSSYLGHCFSCYCGRKSRKSIYFQQPVCIYLLFELLKKPVAENVLKQL